MALQGDVATIPLRDLLGWLAARRASGTLSLSRGMVAWQFHLREGRVLLASSSAKETLLGRLLVERGLIDETQLASALDRCRRSRARLGRTLTRAGLVKASELSRVLAEKAQRLLEEALTWGDGRFFFDDTALPRRRPAVATTFDLAALLERAVARVADAHAVTDADVIEITDLDTLDTDRPRKRKTSRHAA
jgi:hypothetical protein